MRRFITVVSVTIIIQSIQAQETWSAPILTPAIYATKPPPSDKTPAALSADPINIPAVPSPINDIPEPIDPDSSIVTSPISIGAGYFGETITKAGVIVAVGKRISKRSDLHHTRLNVAFYNHPGYNNNLLVLPEYLFRKTSTKGRFFEASAGGGWMYQKPDRTIILYDDGSFTETNRGWSYIAPTILLGGGKKIQNGALKETAFSVGLRWFGQYPFNGFLMHHFALEAKVAIPGYPRKKQ